MALLAQLDVAHQEARRLQAELQARDVELQAVVSRPSSSEAQLRVRRAFDWLVMRSLLTVAVLCSWDVFEPPVCVQASKVIQWRCSNCRPPSPTTLCPAYIYDCCLAIRMLGCWEA